MFPFSKHKPDPLVTDLAAELRLLREAITAPAEDTEEPILTPVGLVERLDSLENRFEELRGTCLRHLQSASQRLKLAESKEDDLEGTNGVAPLLPLPNATPEKQMTPLEYAAQALRDRGESPIL